MVTVAHVRPELPSLRGGPAMNKPKLSRSVQFEDAENIASNPSANPTMGDIIAERLSRRELMRGALAVSAITAAVSPLALAAADRAQAQGANPTPSFNFKELAAGFDDKAYVADGYDMQV